MNRRDFIKNGIVVAAGLAVAGLAAPLSNDHAQEKRSGGIKRMKALLVNGSPHENGNTATALAEVAKTLNSAGIETEVFWIGTKPVHGCVACYACKKLGHCVFDDDPCNALVDKIAKADAVVVGAPVYYGQPNGALLALIQRAMMANSAGVAGKPVACIAVCRRGGATASIQCLNMPFQMLDSLLVGSQYWNIAYGRTPGEAAQDAEGMQTMRRLGTNIAWVLKNLHTEGASPLPAREQWAPMHFIRE